MPYLVDNRRIATRKPTANGLDDAVGVDLIQVIGDGARRQGRASSNDSDENSFGREEPDDRPCESH